jgi:hypothetical protein
VSTSGSPGTGFNTRQSLGSADTINSFRNNGLEFSEPFTRKYFTISLITVKGESFNTFYFSIKKESYVLGIFSQGLRIKLSSHGLFSSWKQKKAMHLPQILGIVNSRGN